MVAPSKKNAIVLDAGKLPSLPRVLLKLIEACHKVDVSFEELSNIIQQDAALSSRVIAVANSPIYAQWQGIKDFNRLLVVLGLGTIKSIAVTSAVQQFFSQFDADADRVMSAFWRSSLACAHSAKALARLTGYEAEDEAYLAGLLHKIGQLVLLRELPSEYTKLLLDVEDDADRDRGERGLFGATCTEVGAMLIENWGLDSFLSDAILYQHEPAESILDAPRLVKLINFAHKLSEHNGLQAKQLEEADLLFGLSQPLVEDLVAEVANQVQQAAKAMGIRLESVREDDLAATAVVKADDERVQLELARQVRNIALIGGMHSSLDDKGDLAGTLQVILQDLGILFGLSRSLCFLCDEAGERLSPAGGEFQADKLHQEFNISLESGRSLVAQSLLQRTLLSSYTPEISISSSVVDHQLAKLLGEEGLLCIPLFTSERNIGVLVAGIAEANFPEMLNHFELITYFAGEAAQAVTRRYEAVSEKRSLLEEERAQQMLHTRKLIHEANNPLGIINNYLEILSIKLGEDQTTQFQFSILKEEIDRVAGILLRMRDMPGSEPCPQGEGEVDLNRVILDLLSIFRASLFTTHSIQDELRLDDALPLLLSNRNSLKQILTNLIKNAVEAMPEGGAIFIATRGKVNVNGRLYVELIVGDNGPGISDEVMANIFTPVVSSKGKAHSGLGLTIVKNLVSDLHGTISCRSSKSDGTEFCVLLPFKTRS